MTKKKKKPKTKKKFRALIDANSAILSLKWNQGNMKKKVNYKMVGSKIVRDDTMVYAQAKKENRHVITHNLKDFKNLPKKIKDPGVLSYRLSKKAIENLESYIIQTSNEKFFNTVVEATEKGIRFIK